MLNSTPGSPNSRDSTETDKVATMASDRMSFDFLNGTGNTSDEGSVFRYDVTDSGAQEISNRNPKADDTFTNGHLYNGNDTTMTESEDVIMDQVVTADLTQVNTDSSAKVKNEVSNGIGQSSSLSSISTSSSSQLVHRLLSSLTRSVLTCLIL